MTGRQHIDYTARSESTGGFVGFDPDVPIAGFFKMRLRSGGVFVGVKIWMGPPLDPFDGTELDRSHRWNALANGRPIDLERAWPKCAGDPIDAAEYAYLTQLQAWGEENAPNSPQANPNKPVDLLTAPLPF